MQLDNGIPIIPFYDNKKDREMLNLEGYLMQYLNQDIRDLNRKTFKLHLYQREFRKEM